MPAEEKDSKAEKPKGDPGLAAGSDSPLPGNSRIVAVVATALVVAVVAFLLLSGGDDEPEPEPAPPVASVKTDPEVVSAADLSGLSVELGHPLYWLGPRPGTELEVTREANGDTYLRYLTDGAEVGDPRSRFITVGTYPVPDATAAVRSAAAGAGKEPTKIPGGGLAFLDERSVYLAYPGGDLQVEVYAPQPGQAEELVADGRVVPVG